MKRSSRVRLSYMIQKKPSDEGGQMNMICGFSWMTLPMNEVSQAGIVANEGFKSPRTGSRRHL
ncbi:MAG: hypothetical protein U0J65_03805 [Christensenellales bacterium]|nr:hypothetical protein [Christensenellales bacterium]